MHVKTTSRRFNDQTDDKKSSFVSDEAVFENELKYKYKKRSFSQLVFVLRSLINALPVFCDNQGDFLTFRSII